MYSMSDIEPQKSQNRLFSWRKPPQQKWINDNNFYTFFSKNTTLNVHYTLRFWYNQKNFENKFISFTLHAHAFFEQFIQWIWWVFHMMHMKSFGLSNAHNLNFERFSKYWKRRFKSTVWPVSKSLFSFQLFL